MSEPQPIRVVLTHPAGWIASGFGVGLAPFAAGTFGSIAALIPWWFWLRHLSPPVYLSIVAIAFVIGIWAGNWVIDKTRIEDPGVVVWDEFIGQWLALTPMLLAPSDWRWMLAGFVLFRIFDIWKPWPIRWADRALHGGFGAMFDDLLAGALALGILQLAAVGLARL